MTQPLPFFIVLKKTILMKALSKIKHFIFLSLLALGIVSCTNEPAEGTVPTIGYQNELFKLMLNTTSQNGDPMKEQICIDFVYPFQLLVYNTNREPVQNLTMTDDSTLFQTLVDLPLNHTISISYPIETTDSNGNIISINNDDELLISLRSCSDESVISYITGQFCTPTSCVTKIPYLPDNADNEYAGAIFYANPDGTITLRHLGNNYLGTWTVMFINRKSYININFAGINPIATYWNKSYHYLGFVGPYRKLTYSGGERFFLQTCNEILPYQVGDFGPSGGIIAYDKGSYSEGWRYMEVAPNDLPISEWGCVTSNMMNAQFDGVGSGYQNSVAIANFHQSLNQYATNPGICSALNNGSVAAFSALTNDFGDQRDWCLPSHDELKLIHDNLHMNGAGGFSATPYWSSTDTGTPQAKCIDFNTGATVLLPKNTTNVGTRMVRYF